MKISCMKRDVTGTGASNKLRKEAFIPGVVYGKGKEPVNIALRRKDMEALLKELGPNGILDLEVNGKTYHAMLKEVQKDPILGELLHGDFMQIGKGQKVVVAVPVHLENGEFLNREGTLLHLLDYVEVECLAEEIPKGIHVDVSGMKVGDVFTVADLIVPDGAVVLNDAHDAVASLAHLRVEEEREDIQEPEEPKLVGKKSASEDED